MHNKNFHSFAIKALLEDKLNIVQMVRFVFGWVEILENILEKGENADHKHFLLFPKCFQN